MKEFDDIIKNAKSDKSISPVNTKNNSSSKEITQIKIPEINLPKGGGAIKGIDEKFSSNAANGTASFSVPLPFSHARGVSPSLSVSYNSGSGNGSFGLGWNINLSSIKRKTDKGLPQYLDSEDSDTFLLSDAEDLVPVFKKKTDGRFDMDSQDNYMLHEKDSSDNLYTLRYYSPRIEGLFARIERWRHKISGQIKWRVIDRSNVTTLYGWTTVSTIAD
ncbi:MAG: SpvB/TcaC N-terminal domain-containing protein, partial [Ginsengibacter sp.]